MKVMTNVEYTQAYGARLCLHVGSVAVMIGQWDGYATRIEIATPLHWFRYRKPARKARRGGAK